MTPDQAQSLFARLSFSAGLAAGELGIEPSDFRLELRVRLDSSADMTVLHIGRGLGGPEQLDQ